jgi:hypothetical protein
LSSRPRIGALRGVTHVPLACRAAMSCLLSQDRRL